MTKLRPPLSFEDALTRIAGVMGWDEAAAVIGQKDRTLRNYSDPDTTAGISLADALRLDLAYRMAGGEGAPIFEAYALQLDITNRAIDASGDELARRAAVAAKEGGEAIAALIANTRPGATPADRALALREVRESIDAFRATLPVLDIDGGMPISAGRFPMGDG